MSYSPILMVHICAGTMGLLSGATATVYRTLFAKISLSPAAIFSYKPPSPVRTVGVIKG